MPEIVKRTLSRSVRASMTVETSIVMPLFLIFFINLSSAIEMIRLHGNMTTVLWNTGSDLAFYGALITEPVKEMGKTGHKSVDKEEEVEGSPSEEEKLNEEEKSLGREIMKELGDLVVSYAYIKNRIIDYLGADYLENSPIRGGSDGLCMIESEIFTDEDIVDIGVTYSVSPPIDIGGLMSFRMSNRYYAHLWNGYRVGKKEDEEEKDITVYVTKDSEVYHTSPRCTYLKLAIRPSTMSALSYERNADGSRYRRCLLCTWDDPPDTIYLCDEGEKYHFSRNCYALKRSYSAVKLSTVINTHRACSRCGGFHGFGKLDIGDKHGDLFDLAFCA